MQAMRLRARLDALRVARDLLPRGRTLPLDVWASRHRCICVVLWLHVLGIAVFAVLRGHGLLHVLADVAVVAAAALAAGWNGFSRLTRSCLATFGLVLSSAILVHVSGGMIELHFHFFVVVAAVTLYPECRRSSSPSASSSSTTACSACSIRGRSTTIPTPGAGRGCGRWSTAPSCWRPASPA